MSAEDFFRLGDPDEMRAVANELYTRFVGEGYTLGGKDADPNGVAEVLEGELLIRAREDDGVAIYRMPDGRAILVSHQDDMLRAVDILPDGARQAMNRPGGTLTDYQEYEELQKAAEKSAIDGFFDPIERVLDGPESDGSGQDRIADPVEESELELGASYTTRALVEERANEDDLPEEDRHLLHEKTENRFLDSLERKDRAKAHEIQSEDDETKRRGR